MSKCKTFAKSNPDKLIAVHCTHGCNRTGFLICAYLIDIMKVSVREAITMFNEARPPGIHKMFVIEELVSRYSSERSDEEDSSHKEFIECEMKRLEGLKLGA